MASSDTITLLLWTIMQPLGEQHPLPPPPLRTPLTLLKTPFIVEQTSCDLRFPCWIFVYLLVWFNASVSYIAGCHTRLMEPLPTQLGASLLVWFNASVSYIAGCHTRLMEPLPTQLGASERSCAAGATSLKIVLFCEATCI